MRDKKYKKKVKRKKVKKNKKITDKLFLYVF